MKNQLLRIKSIDRLTHDVLRIITEKPIDIQFEHGKAVKISINKIDCKEKEISSNSTNLPKNTVLEFSIKNYPKKCGISNEFFNLIADDDYIVHHVLGTIIYKGEGVFIAGGAGTTPFISVVNNLTTKNGIVRNKKIWANKTKADILKENDFQALLREAFFNLLSDEDLEGYNRGRITEEFLKEIIADFSQQFYICGPSTRLKALEFQISN